jgi:polyphosphate kinase
MGLLTSDAEIGDDATSLFNFLTGYSQQTEFAKLMVAPLNLRERFVELIRRESENAADGKPARIIIKTNGLTDTNLIEELYAASTVGVEIDLIVRGICSLRPGVSGLSDNIRVRSVVGRFLEHSRIYYFANSGAAEEVYIGSADWMQRNLDRRVEVVVPILDPEIRDYLKEEVLDSYLRDNVNASILKTDGSYAEVLENGSMPFNSQLYFIGTDILA